MEYDAVVAAGGAGRRLGGVDKPAVVVGGRTMLDRVLDACAGARSVVVVGPRRATAATGVPVHWARESPVGGGPLAAVAAGMEALPAPVAPVVVVLAADLPYLDRATVQRLVGGLGTGAGAGDAACLVDESGHRQPLAAAYRTSAMRAVLSAAEPLSGRGIGRVVAGLRTVEIPAGRAALDVDTPADLESARSTLGAGSGRPDSTRVSTPGSAPDRTTDSVPDERGDPPMQEYVRRLAELLGLDPDTVDVRAVLDLARDAAHHVERPAAPVTTYLVGLAAGRAGGSAKDVERARQVATELALSWPAPAE